jgi:hypothetical protein
MYVYYVYPAISKSPKELPNCLKIAETSVILTFSKEFVLQTGCLSHINTKVYLTTFNSTEKHTVAG